MSTPPLRIGTRGSRLAMVQTSEVLGGLTERHDGIEAEIVVVATSGDSRRKPVAGGKGLFTGELETALLDGRIDVAVHSMKDLPAPVSDGLAVDCFLPREDPRDMLVASGARDLDALPAAATFGTSSPRRRALALRRRPDLRVVPLHGNVETRLGRVRDGEIDATILAAAGLNRLGYGDVGAVPLDPGTFLPAACQGIVGAQRRAEDRATAALLEPLNDAEAAACAVAERAFLEGTEGSCATPVAALASCAAGRLTLRAAIARPDGSEVLETGREGPADAAAALGADAAAELRGRAGPDFFDD